MKNNKIAKIITMILTAALCLGAAFAMSASAETEAPTPVISSQNIEYNSEFSLMYAVPAATVTEGASVTIYVHDTEPTEATYSAGVAYTVTATTAKDNPETTDVVEGSGLPYEAYIFTTAGIGAKSFTDEFYVVAKDNTSGKYSEVVRYSVAEYLYERLATAGITDAQKALYTGAISFGDGAQQALNRLDPNDTADAAKLISNLRYVTVSGGSIDGYKTGVYPVGSTLNLVPDEGDVAKWTVENYTNGTAADPLINQTLVTVGDYEKIAITCGETVVMHYQDGYLDFNTIADGTAYNQYLEGGKLGNIIKGPSTSYDTANSISFVDNGDSRGTVLYAQSITASSYPRFYSASLTGKTFATVTDATAQETSFDIKLALSGDADDRLWIRMFTRNGIFDVTLYQYTKDSDGKAALRDKLVVNGTEVDVNASEWFNIKMVTYAADRSYMYVYINEDAVIKINVSDADAGTWEAPKTSGYDGDTRFTGNGDGAESIYLDNIFVGYTTSTVESPFYTETETGE